MFYNNVFWSGGPLLVVDQQRPVVDRKILKQIEVIIRSKENLQNNTPLFFCKCIDIIDVIFNNIQLAGLARRYIATQIFCMQKKHIEIIHID